MSTDYGNGEDHDGHQNNEKKSVDHVKRKKNRGELAITEWGKKNKITHRLESEL